MRSHDRARTRCLSAPTVVARENSLPLKCTSLGTVCLAAAAVRHVTLARRRESGGRHVRHGVSRKCICNVTFLALRVVKTLDSSRRSSQFLSFVFLVRQCINMKSLCFVLSTSLHPGLVLAPPTSLSNCRSKLSSLSTTSCRRLWMTQRLADRHTDHAASERQWAMSSRRHVYGKLLSFFSCAFC